MLVTEALAVGLGEGGCEGAGVGANGWDTGECARDEVATVLNSAVVVDLRLKVAPAAWNRL